MSEPSAEENKDETIKHLLSKVDDLERRVALADAIKQLEPRVAELETYPKAIKYSASVVAVFAAIFLTIITVFGTRLSSQVDRSFEALGQARGEAANMRDRMSEASKELMEAKGIVNRALEARAVAEQSVQSMRDISKEQLESYNKNLQQMQTEAGNIVNRAIEARAVAERSVQSMRDISKEQLESSNKILQEMQALLRNSNFSAQEVARVIESAKLPADIVRATQLTPLIESIEQMRVAITQMASINAATKFCLVQREGGAPSYNDTFILPSVATIDTCQGYAFGAHGAGGGTPTYYYLGCISSSSDSPPSMMLYQPRTRSTERAPKPASPNPCRW